MTPKNILKWSFLNAVGALAYVALVVWFITHAQQWFGAKPGYLGSLVFLVLFVFSAAVMGSLVLGRPILLYLDGAKKEALRLFGLTLVWIFAALCVLSVFLALLY